MLLCMHTCPCNSSAQAYSCPPTLPCPALPSAALPRKRNVRNERHTEQKVRAGKSKR